MSWRDRAIPVTEDQPVKTTSSWRDRAVQVEEDPPGALTSAALGAGQGLLSNFGEEILSRGKALGDVAFTDKTMSDYPQLVEESQKGMRDYLASAKEAHPLAYGAGEIGGGIAQTFVPGLGFTKGATALNALKATTQGALSGLGASEDKSLESAGTGAAGGLLGYGVGGAIGKGVGALGKTAAKEVGGLPSKLGESGGIAAEAGGIGTKLASHLTDRSQKRAVKAAGAMLKDFRALDNQGRLNEAGQMLLDKKVVTAGDNLVSIADKAKKIVDETGAQLKQVYSGLDSQWDDFIKGGMKDKLFNPRKAAMRLQSELLDPTSGTAMEDATGPVMNEISRLIKRGGEPIKFSDAKKIISGIDKFVEHSKEQTPQKELLKQARGILNSELENSIEAVMTAGKAKEYFPKWKEAKKVFGIMKPVQEMAEDRLFREDANRFISPSDYGMGVGGAAVGAVTGGMPQAAIMGAGSALANKAARAYGPALGAKAYQGAAKLAGKSQGLLNTAQNIGSETFKRASPKIGEMSLRK